MFGRMSVFCKCETLRPKFSNLESYLLVVNGVIYVAIGHYKGDGPIIII